MSYQIVVVLLMLAGWMTANHFGPWVSWHSELPFFVVGVAMAVHAIVRNGLRPTLELPPVGAFPLLLFAILTIQAALGFIDWHGQVFVVALYLMLALTAMTWGYREGQVASAPTNRFGLSAGEWLAWALIAGAVLSVGVALAQVLGIADGLSFVAPMSYARRPGANMAQPNHLATLLVMSMAGACYLYMLRRLGIRVLSLLAIYLAFGLALTESRTGLLSLLALCLFLLWKRPNACARLALAWPLLLGASAAGMFLIWPTLYRAYSLGLDMGEAATERLASSGGDPRLTLWHQMLEASVERPWLGWGIRDTAEAHNAIAHEHLSALPVTYSHNLAIDLVLWIGWPLALIVMLGMATWIWHRLRNACNEPRAWFGMAVLLPFGIHSLLEFPFAYAYLLLPAMYGMGLVDSAGADRERPLRVPTWGAAPVVLALASGGIWSVVDYLRVEEDFRVARFQMLRIGPPQEGPSPEIHLLNQLGDMVAATRVPLSAPTSPVHLEQLRLVAMHNPWAGAQYRYATALALNGFPEQAKRQLLVLRAQHGPRTYKALSAQLEQELAKRGLPPLMSSPQIP